MRAFLLGLAVFLAFFLPSNAAASPASLPLGDHVSNEGEDMEAFLLRLAPTLEAYTAETGFEACGFVAQNEDGTRLGVRLVTSRGALTCFMRRADVPEGMTAMRATIHSHPQRSKVAPTASDIAFHATRPSASGRVVRRGQLESTGHAHGAAFSAADYEGGAGYLVTHGALHYQEGRGTERVVGSF